MRKIFTVLLLLWFIPLLHSEDIPHYGYQIPHTPLYVGGYISAVYDKEEYDDIVFDDIALLFYANRDKYHFLSELEISDLPLQGGKNTDIRIYIERFVLSYDQDEYTTISVGKFNSDIGFWNIAPINTLTDTTTSPHIMEVMFPELTTGIEYAKSLSDEEILFSLTLQNNSDMDKQYNNFYINRHYAFMLRYAGYNHTLKLNGGYFKETNNKESFYAGIAYQHESDKWTLQSELFTREAVNAKDIPYNGYIQLTRHFGIHHDIVAREEIYKDNIANVRENISLIGYTYRPRTSIALKGEYVHHSKLPRHLLIISASMVF